MGLSDDKAEQYDRMAHKARGGTRKYFGGWTPPGPDEPDHDEDMTRHGVGGNNPPAYDPEAPVTGFPMLMRDISPVSLDGQSELTSRSQVREFEREHGVERTGLDYSGSEKPAWWDEYKDNRQERDKRKRQGKAGPKPFLPHKPGTKKERKHAK